MSESETSGATNTVAEAKAPGAAPGRVASPARFKAASLGLLAGRYGLLAVFLATIVVFSLLRPHTFPTIENLKGILEVASPALIMAVGLTVILVMQDFDLSFGGMIGLAAGASTYAIVDHGVGWILAILIVLAIGVLVGCANGFMISFLGGNSFIITLAMGTVLTGIEFALTGQNTVFSGYPSGFLKIAQGSFLGFSHEIWIAAVLAVLVWVLLDRTELGRYMYAIGGNQEASRLAGIRVKPYRLLGFVAVGVAAAVVGLLIVSLGSSYSPNVGASYLLPAFAAVFLGAAVFRPGEFNVPGTIVGVLFLGVLQTGLIMLSFETYVINLVQGGILITAVLVSRLGAKAL